jgi:hypothetical protein
MLGRFFQHIPRAALPWLVVLGLVLALIVVAVGGGLVLAILGLLVGWLGFPLAYATYMRTCSEIRTDLAPTEEP